MGADGGGQLGVGAGALTSTKAYFPPSHWDGDPAGGVTSMPISWPSRRMWSTAPGRGAVGIVQLDELDLYLRVILKNERYVRLPSQ